MAQKEPDIGPSLELPALFGRRKRRTQAEGSTTTVTAVHEAVSEPIAEPVAEAPMSPPQPAVPAVTPTPVPQPVPAAETTSSTATASGTPREKPTRSVPAMAASTAAFLVGAVVGLLGCVLTYVGLQGCELVTGTDSCGGPGLLVLVVILALMIVAGAAALRALRVPEAGNVSFLGVGIMTAIVLLFLIDYLYDPWMFAVVPALTAISYAVARWITTLYSDDLDGDDGGMPHHDIR
jgi:hypothetical protein